MRLDEANRRAPPLLDLDELNYGFPPWFARGHSLTVDEAMRLAAIIGIEYCERFRLEIGVAIQMTAERLIRKQLDEFLELERVIDYRKLDESLNVLIGRHDFPGRVAAVALNSTLSHKFGDDWRTNSRIERLAKVLIADLKRKRGRPDSAAVAVFFGALVDVVRDFGGALALPSNENPRETPLMIFTRECARRAKSIGENVIVARSDRSLTPSQFIMTGSEYSAAIASLSQLNLSDRALCERLRALRKAKILTLQDFIRRIIRPSQCKKAS